MLLRRSDEASFEPDFTLPGVTSGVWGSLCTPTRRSGSLLEYNTAGDNLAEHRLQNLLKFTHHGV